METQPGKAYNVLKRLGAQPGDTVDADSFMLTAQQSADRSSPTSARSILPYGWTAWTLGWSRVFKTIYF